MKKLESYEVDQIEMGFTIVRGKARPFTNLHRHNEIEIGIVTRGLQKAVFGKRRVRIPSNHLGIFWANQPHGPIQVEQGNTTINLFIPLPWFLNWHLPDRFVQAVLHGEFIMDSPQSKPCSDIDLMKHWSRLMKDGSEEAREIVLLELQARLRRMARDLSTKLPYHTTEADMDPTAHWTKYEMMVALLADKYLEPLTVPDVAEAVGLHPAYAMRLFKKMSGTTIQQCIIQHRISHAQRLIATTSEKILTVALESGFNSVTQFYSAFRRTVGQTPRSYRQSLRR